MFLEKRAHAFHLTDPPLLSYADTIVPVPGDLRERTLQMNPPPANQESSESSEPFPQVGKREAEEESFAPDPQELRAVREILLSLSKVVKASRVYNPDNPAYQKLLQDFTKNLLEFLRDGTILTWDIGQFQISYDGEPVYQNRDPSESLAFHLYKDGLRRLQFSEGLEAEEIHDFLHLLQSTLFEPDEDDDLATLLWEKNFANIHAVVVDASRSAGEGGEGSDLATLSRRLIDHGKAEIGVSSGVTSGSGAGEDPGPAAGLPDAMPFMPGGSLFLFSVGEDEVEKIKAEMNEEAGRDLAQEFISLLLEILSAKEDIAGSREILAIVERIAESYCLQGNFLKAFQIVRDLRQLLELPLGLPDSRRAAISESIGRMGSSERIGKLSKVLDRADEGALQVFKYYASLLGTQAIVPLCEMLGDLEQMKARRILCEAIAEMAQGHVEQLEPATRDQRWFVARNAAYILGMVRDSQGMKYLKGLAQHREPRVRKEAIRSLGAIGDGDCREFLLTYLPSSEGATQALTARVLANLGEKRALPTLVKLLEERQFPDRDREEKREILDAAGRLGSDQLLPLLRGFLYRKAIFHREKFEEMREGAALALASLGTEAARRILQEGARGNDKAIAHVCRNALSQIRFSGRAEDEKVP
jgi:hypothetical protein